MRAATRGPTARPMRQDPVADISGSRGSSTSFSPISRPPITTAINPSGASPYSASARAKSCAKARAVTGVFSDGFQTTGSPHTIAIAKFQAQTATGKLKAEITPMGPSGCQISRIA